MPFTINCPSCQRELTIVKHLVDKYLELHSDEIKNSPEFQLTRLPNISIKPIIEATEIKSCCVAEIMTLVDRTVLIYGAAPRT